MLRKVIFAVMLMFGFGGLALTAGSAQAAVVQGGAGASLASPAAPSAEPVAYYYRHYYYRPAYHYGRPHYYRPHYYRPHYYRPYYYRPRCRIVWVKKWRYGRYYNQRRRVCW